MHYLNKICVNEQAPGRVATNCKAMRFTLNLDLPETGQKLLLFSSLQNSDVLERLDMDVVRNEQSL